MNIYIKNILLFIVAVILLYGCSTTSSLQNDEVLYTGLISTDYNNYESNSHQRVVEEEVEAALATAPNGALFGSSYYRTPFPYGLYGTHCQRKKVLYQNGL